MPEYAIRFPVTKEIATAMSNHAEKPHLFCLSKGDTTMRAKSSTNSVFLRVPTEVAAKIAGSADEVLQICIPETAIAEISLLSGDVLTCRLLAENEVERSGSVKDYISLYVPQGDKAKTTTTKKNFIDINLTPLYADGIIQLSMFKASGRKKVQNLDQAIKMLSVAVAIRTMMPDAQDLCQAPRYRWLMAFGEALYERDQMEGDAASIVHVCEQFRAALGICPSDSPDRSVLLDMLGQALFTAFLRTPDSMHLDAAMDVLYQAESNPIDRPIYALRRIAEGLWAKYAFEQEETIRRPYIEAGIERCRKVIELVLPDNAPIEDQRRLSLFLLERWKWSRSVSDLNEAVDLLTVIYKSDASTVYQRVDDLRCLGFSLMRRFHHTQDKTDLVEGVRIYQRLFLDILQEHSIPQNFSPSTGVFVSASGRSHWSPQVSLKKKVSRELFDVLWDVIGGPGFGDSVDVEDIVRTGLELLKFPSEDDLLRADFKMPATDADRENIWECLRLYGHIYHMKFVASGELLDLDRAALWREKALELCPSTAPYYSSLLYDHGFALGQRYDRTQVVDDMKQSIALLRESLKLRPVGNPDRWRSLYGLGTALAKSWEERLGIATQDEAIAVLTEGAACITNPDDTSLDQARLHHTVAMALVDRAGTLIRARDRGETISELDVAADLDRALVSLEKISRSTIRSSQDSARQLLISDTLQTIQDVYQLRYRWKKNIHDLENAIRFGEEALEMKTPDSLFYSETCSLLAASYFLEEPRPETHDPFALLEKAVTAPMSTGPHRLQMAMFWIDQAGLHNHPSAIVAHHHTLSLLELCLMLRPTVESQHQLIAQLPIELPATAFAFAVQAGRYAHAVELLEQSRGFLWGRLARFRHPLHAIKDVDIDLANELEATGKELETLFLVGDAPNAPSMTLDGLHPFASRRTTSDRQIQRLHRASQRWEKAVNRVRQLKGFNDFLQTVPFPELQKAAIDGPIIIASTCGDRTDALIVCADRPPVHIPIRGVKWDDINRLSTKLTKNLDSIIQSDDTQPSTGRKGKRRKEEVAIENVFKKLWTFVVEPIANALEALGVPRQSPVWWYPVSVFCKLPLHAAGPYLDGKLNFCDLYISSYMTSFARSLKSSAAALEQSMSKDLPSMLIVGVPGEPNGDYFLENVESEIAGISRYWHSVTSSPLQMLVGENADSESIRSVLPQHPWIHITCHGLQDPNAPFNSFFRLNGDDRLSLKDIAQSDLPRAELAFLSACDTAKGDRVSNEVIHLAAAMQFCGFHSVVGTMWPMADTDGPMIAEDFYRYMLRPPDGKAVSFRNSAAALHFAVKNLRESNVPPSRWINFVHYGL